MPKDFHATVTYLSELAIKSGKDNLMIIGFNGSLVVVDDSFADAYIGTSIAVVGESHFPIFYRDNEVLSPEDFALRRKVANRYTEMTTLTPKSGVGVEYLTELVLGFLNPLGNDAEVQKFASLVTRLEPDLQYKVFDLVTRMIKSWASRSSEDPRIVDVLKKACALQAAFKKKETSDD